MKSQSRTHLPAPVSPEACEQVLAIYFRSDQASREYLECSSHSNQSITRLHHLRVQMQYSGPFYLLIQLGRLVLGPKLGSFHRRYRCTTGHATGQPASTSQQTLSPHPRTIPIPDERRAILRPRGSPLLCGLLGQSQSVCHRARNSLTIFPLEGQKHLGLFPLLNPVHLPFAET